MRRVQLILLKESLPVKVSTPQTREFTLKTYNDILKSFYIPEVIRILNSKLIFRRALEHAEERRESELGRFHRDIPWWRRWFGLVCCPRWGGNQMYSVKTGRAWVCTECAEEDTTTILVHKKGGKKLCL